MFCLLWGNGWYISLPVIASGCYENPLLPQSVVVFTYSRSYENPLLPQSVVVFTYSRSSETPQRRAATPQKPNPKNV
jgi:hypothetical protein